MLRFCYLALNEGEVMHIPICHLKAGTTIREINDGRVVADHPDDGLTIIQMTPDAAAPNGLRVDITRAPQGVPCTLTIGHSDD